MIIHAPSYLVRNRTLGPPLENNPEIPPSSRDEGLRLLHGLLFNLYAEYIVLNDRLDEVQAEIKIAGRNINNFRYANDNTFMAETQEELSLLMKVKEESEKVGLKFNTQKTKIMASSPIIFNGKSMGKQWKQWETLFFWAPNSLQMVTAAIKLKDACSLEEKIWPT